MTALLWKELRENLKWALAAMVAMGAALVYALNASPNGQPIFYSYSQDGITLCRKSFLLVTTFGSAAIGLLIGFLQILPELKRDRWAALRHRPVSAGTIFWGKALAGVVLYAIATVPAYGFAVWQVATPGNFGAPFLPDMMKPGIADLGMGLVYYFAALTLTLHQGGWFGLKLFPILAALHTSFFVLSTHLFRVALVAAALMAATLLVAAWGAMQHRESVRARPWPARLAFVVVVFYGACGLGDLARSFLKAVAPSPRSKVVRYELSREGFPLKLTYESNSVVEVSDPEGRPLTDPKFLPDRVRNQIKYLNGFSSFIGDSHGWKPREYPDSYRESQSYLWAESPYTYPRLEQWFNLKKQRNLVCFLPVEKKAVDRLDAEGFQPLSVPPRPFPPHVRQDYGTEDTRILWDEEGVRFAFLAERKILDAPLPAPGPVYGVGHAWDSVGQGSVSVTGVALAGGMAVFDNKARPVAFLPYHHDVARWGQLRMGIKGTLDRFYLWYEPSAWIDAQTRKTMPSYLEERDAQGQVLRSYVLPPLPEFPRRPSLTTTLDRRLQSPALFFGEMLYRKIGAAFGSTRLEKALAAQLGSGWKATRETALWSTGLALLLAVGTFFRASHAQFPKSRAWGWAGFVLLFNLGGFVVFLLVADWPRLVPCAHCRGRRAVGEENCPSCQRGWPPPLATGTEIFDTTQEATV